MEKIRTSIIDLFLCGKNPGGIMKALDIPQKRYWLSYDNLAMGRNLLPTLYRETVPQNIYLPIPATNIFVGGKYPLGRDVNSHRF